MTVIASILQSIRDAASYNKHELAAPRLILWPDEDRLWIRVIERLRARHSFWCSPGTVEMIINRLPVIPGQNRFLRDTNM